MSGLFDMQIAGVDGSGTHRGQSGESLGNGESRSCERLFTMSTHQRGLLTGEYSHRCGT